MSKNIPSQLQDHYNEPVNTTCFVLRTIRSVGANGAPLPIVGITSLDIPIAYDDNEGDGPVTYSALAGFLPSNIVSSSDLSVDNAEAQILIPAYNLGPILESEINAGRYDNAPYVVYKINYRDLTPGNHEIVMKGTLGQNRVVDGLCCFAELRSITQLLKQNVCELDSFTCRATFGDDKCGIDAEALFVPGEVTSIGVEADRVFADSSSGFAADGAYKPGIVEWLTGNNAGRTYEVENNVGGIVTLTFHTKYDIAIGDTYRIRADCGKRFREDCIGQHDNGLQFRGEPDIPVGDESSLGVPGATQINSSFTEYAGAE